MTKCFRAENTKFIKMPTGTSYDQSSCVCSSRTLCTATTAINKISTGKKKNLSDRGILEYNGKGGELSAMYCLNYCTRNWRDCSDTVC